MKLNILFNSSLTQEEVDDNVSIGYLKTLLLNKYNLASIKIIGFKGLVTDKLLLCDCKFMKKDNLLQIIGQEKLLDESTIKTKIYYYDEDDPECIRQNEMNKQINETNLNNITILANNISLIKRQSGDRLTDAEKVLDDIFTHNYNSIVKKMALLNPSLVNVIVSRWNNHEVESLFQSISDLYLMNVFLTCALVQNKPNLFISLYHKFKADLPHVEIELIKTCTQTAIESNSLYILNWLYEKINHLKINEQFLNPNLICTMLKEDDAYLFKLYIENILFGNINPVVALKVCGSLHHGNNEEKKSFEYNIVQHRPFNCLRLLLQRYNLLTVSEINKTKLIGEIINADWYAAGFLFNQFTYEELLQSYKAKNNIELLDHIFFKTDLNDIIAKENFEIKEDRDRVLLMRIFYRTYMRNYLSKEISSRLISERMLVLGIAQVVTDYLYDTPGYNADKINNFAVKHFGENWLNDYYDMYTVYSHHRRMMLDTTQTKEKKQIPINISRRYDASVIRNSHSNNNDNGNYEDYLEGDSMGFIGRAELFEIKGSQITKQLLEKYHYITVNDNLDADFI